MERVHSDNLVGESRRCIVGWAPTIRVPAINGGGGGEYSWVGGNSVGGWEGHSLLPLKL